MVSTWPLTTLATFLCALVAVPLFAVVNSTVPLGNTSAPTGLGLEPTDPGFGYVGKVNGSTGVYIGNGWVLTADHVGAGTFNLGGVNYSYDGVNSHQINNVDLQVFKLSSSPLLAPLTISSATPSVNDDVVMIGAGRTPTSSSPTTWFVDTDPATWAWSTSIFPEADSIASGFTTTSSSKVVRWGTNVVESIDADISYLSYDPMDMIVTDFDETGGTAFESQAVLNDSGSGLFVDNGSGWELAGTIVTVGNHNNQPGGAGSALFGNLTYSVDLSQHAEAIEGYYLAPVPEPAAFAMLFGLAALWLMVSRRGGARSGIHGCRPCP